MPKILYTVESGDYLRKIAKEQLDDESRWPEIAYINDLKHPYIIRLGEVLELPSLSESPLRVVITKGTDQAEATKLEVTPKTTPVSLGVLLLVAAALWINLK